jgi:hypothetical protein
MNKASGLIITCSLLLAGSVLSFTNYVQGPNPNVLIQERINEKMTFDHNQALYNDKANTEIRAKNLVEKKTEKKDQEKKIVEEAQDQTKGQILIKF